MSHAVSGPAEESAHIAVIGMACRFPGARDPEEFWDNLVGGVDTVTRLTERPVPGSERTYVPAGGFLTDSEWFDAGYFGYSPREARIIDPQHRIFLECAVEALESAGCDPDRFPGAIGVYAGGTDTSYAAVLKARRAALPSVTDWEIRLATGIDFLSSRVAYKLGLRGPAVAVRAACATSLVAVHLAAQALLAGDCDLAIAGGAAVHVPAEPGVYADGGILSPDGVCRTFDAAAQGIVGGDGAGLVVLKRLSDALANRDPIHAVLRGSAVNNDGADRIGYTAPSVDGQAAVIRAAQLVAEADPESITYVEAHGTATPIGDPIEIAALTKAFRAGTARRGFCSIGSVKTNIGHTDAAAGGAGIIKTVLSLERGLIPPSLHFSTPNPEIDFAGSPFRVATRLSEWRPEGTVRRAGVSSFGMGGTNAHVVLEQPPEPPPPARARPWQLLVLSARTPAALDAATARLEARLRTRPDLAPADVAWTLQVGRREHPLRRFAVVGGSEDAVRVLSGCAPERLVTSDGAARGRPVVLMFPGTTVRLLQTEPAFARFAEEAYGDGGDGPDLIAFAQEYAVARLLSRWGVRPDAVFGVGVGALVAAVMAGVFPVREAARLVIERARLLRDGPAGGAADRLADLARATRRRPAELPIIADAYGRRLGADEAADPAYWAAHLRTGTEAGTPAALPALPPGSGAILVEAGTGGLAQSARRHPDLAPGHLVVPALAEDAPAERSLLSAIGHLWLAGTPIAWSGVHEGARRAIVGLPTYPFQRQRHVVEPEAAETPTGPAPQAAVEGDVQQVVERLFAEVLGLDLLDPDESFFDLGGDSLIATQLLVWIRRIYPVDIVLRAMFEAPSANAFAALVRARMGGSAEGHDNAD